MTDPVNHPRHYESHKITLEPIDIIEAMPFTVANVFKYVIRAKDKGNELEDLEKALWYAERAEGYCAFGKIVSQPLIAIFAHSDNDLLRRFAEDYLRNDNAQSSWINLKWNIRNHISKLSDEKIKAARYNQAAALTEQGEPHGNILNEG